MPMAARWCLGMLEMLRGLVLRGLVLRVLLLAAMLSLPGACAHAPVAPPERILLVGNSLIYRNDLPAHLAAVSTAVRGAPVEVEMIAGGGRRIEQHAAAGLVQAQLAAGRYDVLVLQEWGSGLLCDPDFKRFGFDCAASHAAHRTLADAARAKGVRVVVLGSYSRSPEAARALADAESQLATGIGATHVGLDALPALLAGYPGLAWFDVDGQHPGADLTLYMASGLSRALYGEEAGPDRALAGLRIAYRDYRDDSAPRPDTLTSAQPLQATVRERRLGAGLPWEGRAQPDRTSRADWISRRDR